MVSLGVASYPQPPDRSQHWCAVGIDCDPPVWQGGGDTRAPALTYVSAGAGVVVHVVVLGRGGFTNSVIRTPPRTISRALSLDLGTALARSTAPTLSSLQAHPRSACARDLGHL